MGTSKSSPNAWMGITGSSGATANNVFAGAGGWYIKHPNGQVELLHAMKGVAEIPVNSADIQLFVNPDDGNYSITAGDELIFVVNWSEPVVVTGTPQINFNENGSAKTADYDVDASTPTQSIFVFEVSAEGDIDTVTTSIQLNSGTIVGADSKDAELTLTFTDDTVASVAVDNGGAGYDTTEAITIDDPNKSNSTATITTTAEDPGAVLTVELEDGGYGYETADGVAIAGGTSGTVDIVVVDGVITEITLNAPGSGYTGAEGVLLATPTLTTTTATADVVFEESPAPNETGTVKSVVLTDGGYGYETGTVAIDGGTNGTVDITVVDEVITAAVINVAGTGYSGTTAVDLADPTLTNSTANVTTTDTGNVIDSVSIDDGGFGYEDGDIALTGGNGDALITIVVTAGVITGVSVADGGTGYTGASAVDLADPTLINSTANVTLFYPGNAIDSLSMTEVGYGYDGLEGYTLDAVGTDAVLDFSDGYVQPTGVVVVA